MRVGDDVTAAVGEGRDVPAHLGLHLVDRAVGKQLLHVDPAVEGESAAELGRHGLRVHPRGGGLEDQEGVYADVDKVAQYRAHRPARMVEDEHVVLAREAHLLCEVRLDVPAPELGANDHALLPGEVVAEPADVEVPPGRLEAAREDVHVELVPPPDERLEDLGLFDQFDQGLFHPEGLARPPEERHPPGAEHQRVVRPGPTRPGEVGRLKTARVGHLVRLDVRDRPGVRERAGRIAKTDIIVRSNRVPLRVEAGPRVVQDIGRHHPLRIGLVHLLPIASDIEQPGQHIVEVPCFGKVLDQRRINVICLGILVGEARKFQEKVILAKIKKAMFHHYVRPGDTITLHAEIESIAPEAASTTGKILCGEKLIAEISLMFSHIDNNLAGKKFPEENFVFTDMFNSLLTDFVDQESKPGQGQ